MAEQYVYEVDISEEGITKAFKRIEDNINRLADVMESSLKRIETAGERSFDKVAKRGKSALKEVEQAAVVTGQAIEDALTVEPGPLPDPRKFPQFYEPRTREEIYQQRPGMETPRKPIFPDLGGITPEQLEAQNQRSAQTIREVEAASRELTLAREQEIATAARLDQQLVQLIASELRNIYSADATTKAYIGMVAATSKSTDQFNQALLVNERITQSQLNYATALAQLKQRIEVVNKSYGQQSQIVGNLESKLAGLEQTANDLEIVGGGQNQAQLKKVNKEYGKTSTELEKQRNIAKALKNELARLAAELNKVEDDEQAMADAAAQNVAAIQNQVEAVDAFKRGLQALAVVAQKQQAAGSRQAVGIIRNYPEQAKQIHDLIRQYGSFEFQLGKTASAQGRVQQEFAKVIATSPRLSSELDKIVAKYGQLNVQVDDIGFGRFNNESKLSATRIGILSGLVTTLTHRLINLGEQLARTFQQFLSDSVKVASEFQQTEISLKAIFEGNQAAAGAFFDFVRAESRRLGTDITALAVQFAPIAEDFEQISRIAEVSAELLRLPGAIAQGRSQTDAIIAFGELVAGQPKSIQSRFNIPIEVTRRIKELQEEFGSLEGAIIGLEEFTTKYGVSFETALGTAPVLIGQIKQEFKDLQGILGEPILEALTEGLKDLQAFVKDNEEDIKELALAVGSLVEEIANLAFGELDNLAEDTSLRSIINDINELRENIVLLNVTLDRYGSILDLISSRADSIRNLFNFGAPAIYEAAANSERFGEALDEVVRKLTALGILIREVFTGAGDAFSNFTDLVLGDISLEEYNKRAIEIAESVANLSLQDILDEQTAALDASSSAYDRRLTSLNENNEVGERLAEAQMIYNSILTEQNKLLEENKTLTEEVALERKKLNQELERRAMEIDLDYQRSILEAEKDFSREREEIARKNQDKIDDIFREHFQDLEDLALDAKRDSEDLDLEAGRKKQDLERDINDKLIDLELEYQRKIEDIRRQFEFDAQEAIRDNDAIRYLAIKRRMQFELEQAKIDRDRKQADVERDGNNRRAELQQQLDREREDAKIANNRKLEDLQIALRRSLEEQRIAKQREIRDQEIAEQQKIEDLKQSYRQQLEDFQKYKEEKLADLNIELKEELQIIEDNIARLEELEAASYDARLELEQAFFEERLAQLGFYIRDKEKLEQKALAESRDIEDPDETDGLSTDSDEGSGDYVQVPDDLSDLNIGELRLLARELAVALGYFNDPAIYGLISGNDRARLEALVNNLARIQETGDTTISPIPRRYGGSATPGNTYLVGEKEPELLQVGFPGKITPLSRLDNFSIPGLSMGTTIDNRREQNINLSMLDPNYLSPTQLAIITEVVKQIFVGVQNA